MMKRKRLLLAALGVLIVLGAIGLIYRGSTFLPVEPVFRDTYWGMSKEEVKKAEPALTVTSETERMIRYFGVPGNIGEMKTRVNLVYGFEEGKLVAACYGFNPGKHIRVDEARTRALSSFALLEEQLSKRYGEPMYQQKEKEPLHGDAGESLHNYFSFWRTEDAVLELKLRERQPFLELPYTFDLCYISPDYFTLKAR